MHTDDLHTNSARIAESTENAAMVNLLKRAKRAEPMA